MKVNIFGKKMTTKDGKKTFFTYFTTLTKKDGSECRCKVKFREVAGSPKNLPCSIEFDRKDANLSDEYYKSEIDGVEIEKSSKVLWVSKFKECEYVDKSLDEFE